MSEHTWHLSCLLTRKKITSLSRAAGVSSSTENVDSCRNFALLGEVKLILRKMANGKRGSFCRSPEETNATFNRKSIVQNEKT